jgi:7-keto-8-aminopelargonate synthetase-like enzyme
MNRHSPLANTLSAAAYWQARHEFSDAKPAIIAQAAEDHLRHLREHPEEKDELLRRYQEASQTVPQAEKMPPTLTHFQTAELNRRIKKAKKSGAPVDDPVVGEYIRKSFEREVMGSTPPTPRSR